MKYNKFDTLDTPYVQRMDKSAPWSDYPRPQLVRDSYLSLNGEWDFGTSKCKDKALFTDKILVPFPPESKLSGLEIEICADDFMHYKRTFTLPESFVSDRVILHFGAVDTICCVYINGCQVCRHEGGYLPFSIDVTEAVVIGENTVYLCVSDELNKDYPYGKQRRDRGGMWYTPVSGIWQSVWLESVCEDYIKALKITPTLHSVKIEIVGGEDQSEILLQDSGESHIFSGKCVELEIENPRLWTPDDPYLYYFTLKSGKDTVKSYFALREVGIDRINNIPRITLNGEPYLFVGPLDQGYFSDGIYLPATSEGYFDDIMNMKSHGFNMLRKHIKIEPDIFYYLCDKLGMAVFQDMVNNSDYSFIVDTALPTIGFKRLGDKFRHRSKRRREIFISHSKATLEQLYSHPCIVYYTIFNEGWGQFDADGVYKILRPLDTTRIMDSTSGWFWKKLTDVDSRHVYFKRVKLGAITDKPVVISEFGGFAHRVEGHVYGDRYFGYKLFDTEKELENGIVELFRDEIAPLINKGISALVYTQLSDVEDETNGLVTYDRQRMKVRCEILAPVIMQMRERIKN